MRYLLAIVLPPVAVLLCGKPFQAFANIFATMCGFAPGVVHALVVVSSHKADLRTDRLIAAINPGSAKQPKQYGFGTLAVMSLAPIIGIGVLISAGKRGPMVRDNHPVVMPDNPPDAAPPARWIIAKHVNREDFRRLEREASGDVPAYTVSYSGDRIDGKRYGDVLIPSLSQKTPVAKREAIAKEIAKREHLDIVRLYRNEDASKGDRSASFAKAHPGADKGVLGSIEDGVFSPPL